MNEPIISATVDIIEQLLGHDSPQPEVIAALERVLAGRRREAGMVRPVELFADWIPLDPLALPDPKLGPYLTVNNHKARNAWGLPSHIFLVGMFHASSGPEGPVSAFSDGDLRQIHACAFYKPVFDISTIAALPVRDPANTRETGLREAAEIARAQAKMHDELPERGHSWAAAKFRDLATATEATIMAPPPPQSGGQSPQHLFDGKSELDAAQIAFETVIYETNETYNIRDEMRFRLRAAIAALDAMRAREGE